MPHKRWSGPIREVKFLDGDAPETVGTFSGLAAVYGNVDRSGEVIEKGAFTKTLSERGSRVQLFWQHMMNEPIGVGAVQDTDAGLKFDGRISLGVDKGRDVYHLLRDGVVDSMSFGYDIVKSRPGKGGVLHLTELKLWEVSLVSIPANPAAVVTSVKSDAFADLANLDPAERIVPIANALAALTIAIRTGASIDEPRRGVLADALKTLGALLVPAQAEAAPSDGTPAPGAADAKTEPEIDELLHSIRELASTVGASAA